MAATPQLAPTLHVPTRAVQLVAHFREHWDVLALPILVVLALPVRWLAPQALIVLNYPGAFDDHWVLDTPFKAIRGIWCGRDVAFPYGPVFQWLFSLPSRIMGLSMAVIYTTYRTPLLWLTFAFAYLTLRLLLPEQPPWKRFVLLLLLCFFWAPWDGRTALAILLFAAFLRAWYGLYERRVNGVWLGCAAAIMCTVGFLYSADTGGFSIGAFLVTLLGVTYEHRHDTQPWPAYGTALLSFAATLAVAIFMINKMMASWFDFRFWRSSLALVSVHRWNEPSAMSSASTARLLAILLTGGGIFLARALIRDERQASVTARSGYLLSAGLYILAGVQIGLIRSDAQHLVQALYPVVFFAGAALFSFAPQTLTWVATCAALGGSVTFGQPVAIFEPSSFQYRLSQIREPLTACPAGCREFQGVCYPSWYAHVLNVGTNYIGQHSGEKDSIVAFPYQYIFGIASGRNVAGGVLQSLIAAGPYLSQVDIAGYQSAAAPAGLYFPDGPLSMAIDEVPNFTRTPNIWFWLNRHYRSDGELSSGMVGLQRDDSRADHLALQPFALTAAAKSYSITEDDSVVDLGDPGWPAAGADFLRLRLTAHYGPLWRVRKPERLQLEITRADGSRDTQSFVAEPNSKTELWFYPWEQSDLGRYFAPDERQWRTTRRPAITHLRLLITSLDWISMKPDKIVVEAADAMRMSLRP
jgi:hypothetical protein